MKKTKVFLNPEQIEHAKTLRAQGVDCQTIASIFNVSQSTISKHTGQPRRTYTEGPQPVGVYPEAEPSAWSPTVPINGQHHAVDWTDVPLNGQTTAPINGQITVSEAINEANLANLVEQAAAIVERLDKIIDLLEVRV